MYAAKTLTAVLAVLLLSAASLRGADSRSLPVPAPYCDGHEANVYPLSLVVRGDGSSFRCTEVQASAIADGRRYGFEDGVDADYNDLVVDVWVSGAGSAAPVAHVRYVSKSADFRHQLVLVVDGTEQAVFQAETTPPGTVFDIPLPERPCPDFALRAEPPLQSVVAGTGARYGVTVQARNGFSAPVSLSLAGLPPGASAAFAPNPLAITGESGLEIATTAATPAGTYPLTIRGEGGGLARETGVTLVVEALPPDFTVEVRPARRTIQAGQSASYQVRLTARNGFAAPVSLGAGPAPAGAAVSIQPPLLTPDGMAELRVTTGAGTPAGSYPLQVTAEGGGIRHQAGATLEVTAAPPPVPQATIGKAFDAADAFPGQEVSFTIRARNGGAGELGAPVLSDELSPSLQYLGDDATLPPTRSGRRLEWAIGPLAAGSEKAIRVRVRVAPDTPPGTIENVARLTSGVPGKTEAIESPVARLVIKAPRVRVQKLVAQASARPGDALDYRLRLVNESDVLLAGVTLDDELAAGLEFVSQEGPLPFTRQGGRLRWQGALEPRQEIEIGFRARVGDDVMAGTRLLNRARLEASTPEAAADSNTVETLVGSDPVRPDQVQFRKRVEVPQAEVGRIVRFGLTIDNRSASSLLRPAIEDQLPQGLDYVPGSTLVDGRPAADPVGGGRHLTWELAAVRPGQSLQLRYQVVIGADAARGRHLNRAWLLATDSSGQALRLEASAGLTIGGDSLVFTGGLAGTVFLDRDGDEFLSPADTPLAGIEVVTSGGLSGVTDERGRFAFENLFPGEYAVAVNRATLPEKYRPADPGPQLVTLTPGLTDTVDFALRFRNEDDRRPARLVGRVFFDRDGDGALGSGDLPLQEFQARLDNREVCRGQDGRFVFTRLAPGRHRLEILYAGRVERREIGLQKGDNAIDVALRFSGIRITVRGEE